MCTILVGMSTCGMSAGAKDTYKSLEGLVNGSGDTLTFTGCIGMCFREPLVEIREGDRRTIYGNVDSKRAKEVYERHIVDGEEIPNLVFCFVKEDVVV